MLQMSSVRYIGRYRSFFSRKDCDIDNLRKEKTEPIARFNIEKEFNLDSGYLSF